MKKAANSALSGPEPGFFSLQVSEARIFYRDITAKNALHVISGGCEHCSPNYRNERNTFPYFCLELVVGGSGTVVWGDKSHPLGPGSVFSYGPGIFHRIQSDEHRPLVKYFIDFSGKAARQRLNESGVAPGTLSQISPTTALIVRETFEQLIDAGLSTSPHAPQLCTLLLETLLVRCADGRVPLPGSADDTHAFTTYRRCREYIDEHASSLRSTREAARACYINESYLCRLFDRFAGVSPLQHLTRLRINVATQSLVEPGRLVKEVAEELGFVDPYHFSRTFKKICGVSPQEFLRLRRR
jgi:AraC-like DNA-binding protein